MHPEAVPELPKCAPESSGDLPETRLERRAVPETPPKRDSLLSHYKTTDFAVFAGHIGTPPRPPAPRPYNYPTIPLTLSRYPLHRPARLEPRSEPGVGGFKRPAATCADPEK